MTAMYLVAYLAMPTLVLAIGILAALLHERSVERR